MNKLIDPFNRQITYLRVSVTDHCNYHCFYCRDKNHIIKTTNDEILNYEEITRIVRLFSELGVSKVRLTGGEPLLRKNILQLTTMLGKVNGINDIPLSTNAHLLEKMAYKLKTSGVNRVNISLDSLDEKRFKNITRGGDLTKVIRGIDAAIAAKISPIKLNFVVMKGVNDDEIENLLDFVIEKNIDIRFIETMPIGSAGIGTLNHHYSEEKILQRIHNHLPNRLITKINNSTSGPAKSFKISNSNSSVGTISAISNNFCSSCNRVRLTAKGVLILCLGQKNSLSLRGALRSGFKDSEIKNLIINAINHKPEKHLFDSAIDNINSVQMVEIGG